MHKTLLTMVAYAALATGVNATVPQYIDTTANHIELNGADWSSLNGQLNKLAAGNDTVVRVLHIGDSHIQAEFLTNELRRLLQEQYGNAGRGLLMPLRLAGTNQSHDYAVTSPLKEGWTQTRLLKYPWPVPPGVTGIAAAPGKDTEVVWHPLADGHKIKSMNLITSEGINDIELDEAADSLVTPVNAGTSIYGAITENGHPGLLYSAIGNNGACYTDYWLIDDFARKTEIFKPSLIVLSMGTNEAFSTMTDSEIDRSVRNMLHTLRNSHPSATFLILTPMECQKNRNHGQRPLSPYYDINTRNAEVAQMLREIARDENVALWDFYKIAGGEGTSERWLADKLMNTDRIHLLKSGYELQAQLLYEALREAVKR